MVRWHGRHRGDRQHAADRAEEGRRGPAEPRLHQVRAPEPGRQRQGPHRARDHPRRRGARRARPPGPADDDHRGHRRQHRHGPRADRRRARLSLHLRDPREASPPTSASRCASSAPRSTSRKAAGIKSPDNFRNVAARLAEENGWFLDEPVPQPGEPRRALRRQELLGDRPGDLRADRRGHTIGAFVSSAGTGGTITGVGTLPQGAACPDVKIVLADPIGSGLGEWVNTGTLGPDGPFAVEGIGSASVPSNLHRDAARLRGEGRRRRGIRDGRAARQGRGPHRRRLDGRQRRRRAARRRAHRLDGPVVTIAADLWDRYRSTPWMKAWEAARGEGVVFMQPYQPS